MNETSISFVDSGISIPEQIMNFFTRFYRVAKSCLCIASGGSRVV
jgi:signal transduction histidine kinase